MTVVDDVTRSLSVNTRDSFEALKMHTSNTDAAD